MQVSCAISGKLNPSPGEAARQVTGTAPVRSVPSTVCTLEVVSEPCMVKGRASRHSLSAFLTHQCAGEDSVQHLGDAQVSNLQQPGSTDQNVL